MTPQLVALDLDGTCVRYEPQFEIDPRVVSFFQDVRTRLNLRWVMNSDRWATTMMELAEPLPPKAQPIALLSCQHLIFWRTEDGGYEPHQPWNEQQETLHRQLWQKIQPFFPQWEKQLRDRFDLSFFLSDETAFAQCFTRWEDTLEARCLLREWLAPWPDVQVSGNHEWLFILHAAFSKARVLQECARVLKIAPSRIIAVGDGYNDISMLDGSFTQLVGCPANAAPEVQEVVRRAGGFLSTQKDGQGTLEVIRFYLA